MLDVHETILQQYANAPRLNMILESCNQNIDPRSAIKTWYRDVFSLDTATGWGLDVWGRIVGVARVLPVAKTEYFGFAEADDRSGASRPFDDGIFYRGAPISETYALTDDAFRQLVKAKAAANLCGGGISQINKILMALFGQYGSIWVEETSVRIMTICYTWRLSPAQSTLIIASNVLPRPSGIRLAYRYVSPDDARIKQDGAS